MASTQRTLLWHDYETFGVQPRRDRPAQFAAIRTDLQLNPIGEPIEYYCRPATDYLPDPEACLLTGISPLYCLQHGLPEYQFATSIEHHLAASGTIGVGYNTIRFDDEVTRFLFWRNLIDPYAREWQNDCGRWDLLDTVRTTWALRPKGIKWPRHANGQPSFKLEHLAAENGLLHDKAHDALSDVEATIALARLIHQHHPKLYDFCFRLHKKDAVQTEIGTTPRPFIHISGQYGTDNGCLAIVWPLAWHPHNRNELIVWNLADDPAELFELDAESVRQRLFSRNEDLPSGVSRLPIKTIHINRSPIVIGNLKTLTPANAERWGIDIDLHLRHAAKLATAPRIDALWKTVYTSPEKTAPTDVDESLYGGFLADNDRRTLARLHRLDVDQLITARPAFDDPRLEELLFRYRARNFPELLDQVDQQRWQAWRHRRLYEGQDGYLTLDAYNQRLDEMSNQLPAALMADLRVFAKQTEC